MIADSDGLLASQTFSSTTEGLLNMLTLERRKSSLRIARCNDLAVVQTWLI